MTKKNTLIVVKGKRWVVEGDNYAGFTGFREKQWNFFDVKDYSEFMQEVVQDPETFVVSSIETFTIKPDKVLDVKLQLQLAAEKKEGEKKAERKLRAAELRAEARRIERENGY